MENKHWATAKAEEVLQKHNADKPSVNVFDIVSAENIKLTYFRPHKDTPDILSLLDLEGRRLFLDATLPAKQQSFIIAHQLGHYFLGHDAKRYGVVKAHTNPLNNLTNRTSPKEEQEANIFAVSFLMPEKLVKKVKIKYHLADSDTTTMGQLFGVPHNVAAARQSI